MRIRSNPGRRGLAAAIAALHLALALGAGAHVGPHLDPEIEWLPVDLHHHDYGFATARSDAPHVLDLCLACQFSRLVPRMPAPPAALAAERLAVTRLLPATLADFEAADLDLQGPRAPPLS